MLRIALLVISLLCVHSSQAATVYKYLDANGNVVFTDEPRKGAETLDVQPIPTIPAIPVPPPTPRQVSTEAFKYSKVVIVAPADQTNFVNEMEPIVVKVALVPTLRGGDRLQLVLNGTPKGTPISTTQFTLDSLARGEYNVSISVIDTDGKEVGSSPAISFFIKRNSKLMPKPVKPAPAPAPKKPKASN